MNTHVSKSALILFLISFTFIGNIFAQKAATTTMTYVNANAVLKKTYTKAELELLGKLELTAIYQERFAIITEVLPYLALHTKPGATLAEMSIPQTTANVSHLEKEVKNKQEYIASVNETLVDIIPYADKQNIIWSILFFEDIILRTNYNVNVLPTTTTTTPAPAVVPPAVPAKTE
jgi:hypothetical protein